MVGTGNGEENTQRDKLTLDIRDQLNILLKEWEKNVDLYIDQDKRGFQRIGMFLAVHAGLLVFFTKILMFKPIGFFIACLVAMAGIYLTYITKKMSLRAHAYILLRKAQGMLIENRLKDLITKSNLELDTSEWILTTFTREHIVFQLKDSCQESKKWDSLKNEIEKKLSKHAAKPFGKEWREKSIGHLFWLNQVYCILYVLWGGCFFATAMVQLASVLNKTFHFLFATCL